MKRIELSFDAELLPVKVLKSGRLTMLYEKGNLRYIKCGNTELIRMIYGAVRDENWYTAPYEVRDETIEENENGFVINYTALYSLNDIHYKADFEIEAGGDEISFSMREEALNDFKRNRIGICVLHPIETSAGQEAEIQRPDGTFYSDRFPQIISPRQPFKDIQRMRWHVGGLEVVLTFDGDIFETEDQRNWGDGSYKTYSTPLALPFPVRVTKGEKVAQKVTMKVKGIIGDEAYAPATPDEEKIPFPKIGYSRSPYHRLSEEEIDLLRLVPFDHYRVELKLDRADWLQQWKDALQEAERLMTRLELVVFSSGRTRMDTGWLMSVLEKGEGRVESILPLQEQQNATPPDLLRKIYAPLKKVFPHVKVGYGTNSFFADLNRNRPQNVPFDFVSFSLNPQVHADDTRTIMENAEAAPYLIKTATSFANGQSIVVSPVTFKIRQPFESGENSLLPATADKDERMFTRFGAFWTLHLLKNLSGAENVTLYQTTGYRGLLNSGSDETNPLYDLLKRIKAFDPVYFIQNVTKDFPYEITLENIRGEKLAIRLTGFPTP